MKVELAVLGEGFDDLVFFALRRLPRAGEELKTSHFMQTVGGGAVITAMAAARLRLRTEVISGLSPAAAAALESEGAAVRNLRRAREAPAVTVALSTGSERTFVTFNGVNNVLEPRLAAAAARVRARHAHLAFLPSDCRGWAGIAEQLRRRGTTTSFDPGWNDLLRRNAHFGALLASVDYVFVNEQEARLYSGTESLKEAVFFWKRHTRNVVVKLGRRGSHWLSATHDLRAPAPRVRVVDTTGAGDAFNAGFLYGLLRGGSPERCLQLGNFVGAMSTRAPGGIAALPRMRDLP